MVDKTYRDAFQGDDDITMMLRLEQNTKKLQGAFISPMTFQTTGALYEINWLDIPASIVFEHEGQSIEVGTYSYGHGGETFTFGIPYEILEQYHFQIDVRYTGLALYEYKYIGD